MMMLLPAAAATLTLSLASVFSHRFWPHHGDWASADAGECESSAASGCEA